MKEKYIESERFGRPSSPTDTNISNGSQTENTSMYGSVFRRASNAIIFLRQISQISRENSPKGNRLTVQDIEGDRENDTYAVDSSYLPYDNEPQTYLKLPEITKQNDWISDKGDSSDNPSSSKKKKKKSKKKLKEKDSNLPLPEIKINSEL